MPFFRERRAWSTTPAPLSDLPPSPPQVTTPDPAEIWLRRHGIDNAFDLWRDAQERHIGKLAFLSILQDENLLDREPSATTRDLTRQAQDYAARLSQSGIDGIEGIVATVSNRIAGWRRAKMARSNAPPPPPGSLAAAALSLPSRDELLDAAMRDFPTIRTRYRRLLHDLVADDTRPALADLAPPLDRTLASGAARFIAQATRAPRTVEPEWLARSSEVLLRIEDWALASGRNPFVEAFTEGCVSVSDVSLYLTDIKTCMVLGSKLPGGTARDGFRL